MKIARDIMTKTPFTLKSSMQISTAVQSMIDHHISTAPVVDSNNQLLGQVSEITLLKAYIIASKKENHKRVLYDVKQSFTKPTQVKETDPIDMVVKNILTSPFNRVLVMDSRNHLVGIISPKDILRFLVGEEARSGTMLQEMQILQDRISILKDQLQATKTELNKIDSLVQQSAFMFYSLDAAGNVLIANEKLHNELGYQAKELVGKSFEDIFDTNSYKQAEEFLQKTIASKASEKMYATYVKKSGDHLRVEVVSTPIHGKKGEFIATSTISRILDSDELLRALHGVYDSEEEEI